MVQSGGSDSVSASGQWPAISSSLGFPGLENVVAETHRIYLQDYEVDWVAKRKSNNTQNSSISDRPSSDNLMTNGARGDHRRKLEDLAERPRTRSPDFVKVPKSEYRPVKRKFDTYAGIDTLAASHTTKEILQLRPYPTFSELGNVDIQALSKSIQSHLPTEVANALDVLVIIAGDRRWGLPLSHCADLLESLVDSLAVNTSRLRRGHQPIFSSYSQVVDEVRRSSGSLKYRLSCDGSQQLERCAAIQNTASILTILRNLAFTEINQEPISRTKNVAQVLADAINTLCGVHPQPILSPAVVLDFMKDMITLLSLIGGTLVVDRPDIAQNFTSFILAFSPVISHSDIGSTVYDVREQPYLAPAVDAFAKLLSRDTNRQLFEKSLLLSIEGRDRLEETMTLALAVMPTTTRGDPLQFFARRAPLLHHALIVAEAAASFCLRSGDQYWTDNRGLLSYRFANVLKTLTILSQGTAHGQFLEADLAVFVQRVSIILKLLSEKARVSSSFKGMTRAEKAILFHESGIEI